MLQDLIITMGFVWFARSYGKRKYWEYVFQDEVVVMKLFGPFLFLFNTSKWYNRELGIAALSHLQFWLEQKLNVPKWGSHDPKRSRNWSFYQSQSN
ncbi:hypothetical protein GIB67_019265, partial [Kingdonia uniflora]